MEKFIGVSRQLHIDLSRKLKALKQWIKFWNQEEFGDIFAEKRKLEERLEAIQMQIDCDGSSNALDAEEGRLILDLEERRI